MANPTLTAYRYMRLMALAAVEILFTIPIATYGMVLNITVYPIQPWISWSDTHFDYSQVNLYPAVLWRMSRVSVISIELSRALPLLCAFVFFAFFGFANEAKRNYRKVGNFIREMTKKCLGLGRDCHTQRYVHIIYHPWESSQRSTPSLSRAIPLASTPSFQTPKFSPFYPEPPSYENPRTPSSSTPFARPMSAGNIRSSSSTTFPSPFPEAFTTAQKTMSA